MTFSTEAKKILLLAFPVAVAQLLTASAGLVDTIMSGQAGVADLAGVSIGSAIWLTLGIGVMGLFMAVNPIVAQYIGAGDVHKVQGFMHQVLRVLLVLIMAMFAVVQLNELYLPLFIDDPKVLRVTIGYLNGFSWGIPAFLGMLVLRPYSEGLSFTRAHLIASVVSLAVNILANYMLIFGQWGAPELGGAGAGWATSIAFWAAFFVMLFYSRFHSAYEKASLWVALIPLDRKELMHLMTVGLPVAFTLFVEVSIFSLVAMFLGSRSSAEIAANQIAMNVSYMAFTVPVSLSIAATIRVASEIGAGYPDKARYVALTALKIALVGAIFNFFILIVFATEIASVYSDDQEVIQLAAFLILFAAAFQIADAFVVPTQGCLRGYKDTRIPLLLAILAYWVITIPLGYTLGLTDLIVDEMGAAGFWLALVVGLFISGLFMTIRLLRVARNLSDLTVSSTGS